MVKACYKVGYCASLAHKKLADDRKRVATNPKFQSTSNNFHSNTTPLSGYHFTQVQPIFTIL